MCSGHIKKNYFYELLLLLYELKENVRWLFLMTEFAVSSCRNYSPLTPILSTNLSFKAAFNFDLSG